ncbi:hypothetical protein GQ600_11910 [Phytophthora cactorum]|nr:hypothetical protein GQ600_11910 [Phytophthora cactorum]
MPSKRNWKFILGGHSSSVPADKRVQGLLIPTVQPENRRNQQQMADGTPIEYQVKVGDIFDYYTSSDGILQAPKWKSFLYAVEDYLENDPRLTYHPSRVRHFI